MINKVELGSVNSKYRTPNIKSLDAQKGETSFTGLGNIVLKGIQKCEEKPMVNVAVLDLATAILPRTFFETFIGSKQTDENGNEIKERKLNIMGGFEAFRREFSGLLINCIIPSFVVMGAAKLLEKPIMGSFNKSNLVRSWANQDAIEQIETYYKSAKDVKSEDRVFNTMRSMFENMEGVDGDVSNGGLKRFKDILANDQEYLDALRKTAKNIVSDNPEKGYTKELYKLIVKKTGISENLRIVGEEKFLSNSLGHIIDSTGEMLHGAAKEGIIKDYETSKAVEAAAKEELEQLSKYFGKAKKLVNYKSLAGLGIIIPLAIAAQPINRWITHKMSGKKGAPIYNDDQERILTPEEKKKLTAQKCVAVPLMWGVAGLSMLMDRPSLKMFQFKNIFPTMDQARIISAATFSSRLAAAEDSNELTENTIRDIATFSSFYFLGDYAAKGIATYLENHNKDGIKLINKLKDAPKDANIMQRFWHWAKHTKMKSTDELGAIANDALRSKAINMRAKCQFGNLAFSLLSLGVFIPLYTRTQTNKKQKEKQQQLALSPATGLTNSSKTTAFSQKLMKDSSPAFKSFFS